MDKYWCKRGHFNIDQSNFFRQLVNEYKPKNILETGFCTGRSTVSVLLHANKLEKMISIDIDFDYMKPEGRIYKELLEKNFPQYKAIEGNSRNILTDEFLKEEFPNGIDWFTVDGDHSYEGCLYDLDTVLSHMNVNGIIIVDDYKSGKPNGWHLPQVTKACDDFKNKNKHLESIEWNCLGKGFCVFKIPASPA